MRRVAVPALALALLASGSGCGALTGSGDEPERPEPPAARLAATVAALTETPTLRASYRAWLTQSHLDGEVDLVAGAAMGVDFRFESTLNIDNPESGDGRLVVVADEAYVQSSDYEPPAGREWFGVDRDPPGPYDGPTSPVWHAQVLSRLADPMFLLSQGLTELVTLTATEETVAGVATTVYEGQWQFALDEPGPELAGWAENVMHAAYLDVSLRVDGAGRPLELTVASAAKVLFTLEVEYADHGAGITVDAPPPDLVETT